MAEIADFYFRQLKDIIKEKGIVPIRVIGETRQGMSTVALNVVRCYEELFKMSIDKLKGKRFLKYEHTHEGCDNKHVFYFENGFAIEFGREDGEGSLDLVINEKISLL